MAKYKSTGELIVVIGGIIGLILGILTLLGYSIGLGYHIGGMLGFLFAGILQILVSLVILATSGKINIKILKMEKNAIILLILGIILWIVGGDLGGLITIIGAIIMFL